MTITAQVANSWKARTLTCNLAVYNSLYVDRGPSVGSFLNNPGYPGLADECQASVRMIKS
jgi:hypothetical protein